MTTHVAILLTVFLAACDSPHRQTWWEWCVEQGGYVDRASDTSMGISMSGKPAVVSTTTHFCIRDGKILDVR